MKFPELKIIDKVPNKTKNGDSKELLVVQLDWTEIDAYKIDSSIRSLVYRMRLKNKNWHLINY